MKQIEIWFLNNELILNITKTCSMSFYSSQFTHPINHISHIIIMISPIVFYYLLFVLYSYVFIHLLNVLYYILYIGLLLLTSSILLYNYTDEKK